MTDEQLKAYALAGVTARLATLDRERSELHALLTRFSSESDTAATPVAPSPRTMSADARKRIGDANRQRWAARREAPADAPQLTPSVDAAEVARVLPRRHGLVRPAVPAVPALPPMPRLVKAAN